MSATKPVYWGTSGPVFAWDSGVFGSEENEKSGKTTGKFSVFYDFSFR